MIQQTIIEFVSRADGTGPLYAEVRWDDQRGNLPLLAVMPGFNGDNSAVRPDLERLAGKGVCAVGVNMRGRGSSAGQPDAGGVEIHDIIDGLRAVQSELSPYVAADCWSIVGYSGGGGNALSAVTKFPDRFQVAVSFFGISDYEFWYRSQGRTDCNRRMDQWVGGSPDACPDRYHARNSAAAAGNCLNTEVHLFWDEQETQCPKLMNEIFAVHARQRGHQHIHCHESKTTDSHRWHHGYSTDNPDLIVAEDIFVPAILQRRQNLALAPTGRLVVPGYVVTGDFQFWLGDGRRGLTEIAYDSRATALTIRQGGCA